MRGTSGHEVLAGAISGSAVVGGAIAGPLWATAFDLAAAAATAGIAIHAAQESARDAGMSGASHRALHRVARDAARHQGAPLAAHAVDAMCRARSRDPRALRSFATLLGRATTAHARGLVLQLFGSWCAPLRELTRLAAPFAAARVALESAEFVRSMASSLSEPVEPVFEAIPDAVPPGSGRFFIGTFAHAFEESDDESSPQTWEVAA